MIVREAKNAGPTSVDLITLIMFGNKPILQWSEPRVVQKHHLSKLSRSRRFWTCHGGSVVSGVVTGLFIAIPIIGIPESLRELEIFATAPLFMSILFVGIHGLVGMIRSTVRIFDNNIKYDTYSDSRSWKLEDLSGYDVRSIDVGTGQGRVLVLLTRDGIVHTFEVADQISTEDIESAFAGKLIQIQPEDLGLPEPSEASPP